MCCCILFPSESFSIASNLRAVDVVHNGALNELALAANNPYNLDVRFLFASSSIVFCFSLSNTIVVKVHC